MFKKHYGVGKLSAITSSENAHMAFDDCVSMILLNEPNIREVMAFPKTGEGKDLLMQAPSPAPEKTLRELGITYK
jgi:aspartyl-tRNA synthetase